MITYQNGAYYFGVRRFNGLPLYIKMLAHNVKQFRLALSVFLHSQSFYTHGEYFNQGNILRLLLPCCNKFILLPIYVVTYYYILFHMII
jgi:hypothetical protein